MVTISHQWRMVFYVSLALIVLVGTVTFPGFLSPATVAVKQQLRSLRRGLDMATMMMDDEFGISMDDDDGIGNSTETMVDNTIPTKIGDAVAEVQEETLLGGGQAELVTATPVPTTNTGTTAPVQKPSNPPRTRTSAPSVPTDPPVSPPVLSPVLESTVAPQDPPTVPPRKRTTSPITTPPTAAPTVHYSPDDDDPITDKDFEIVEEVESQLAKQEKVARTAGGFGFVLAICAMIFTAHQMSENPDGIFASICRLAITLASVIVKIICMPCRKVIGTGHPQYTGHMPISSNDYRYRGQDTGGFEMS